MPIKKHSKLEANGIKPRERERERETKNEIDWICLERLSNV